MEKRYQYKFANSHNPEYIVPLIRSDSISGTTIIPEMVYVVKSDVYIFQKVLLHFLLIFLFFGSVKILVVEFLCAKV